MPHNIKERGRSRRREKPVGAKEELSKNKSFSVKRGERKKSIKLKDEREKVSRDPPLPRKTVPT